MKKLLLAITLATSFNAQSESLCDTIHSMATQVMTARQNGVAMPTMVNAFTESMERNNSHNLKDLIFDVIEMAYDEPRYSVQDNKDEAIKDYANEWYLACFKELGV